LIILLNIWGQVIVEDFGHPCMKTVQYLLDMILGYVIVRLVLL